MLVKEFFQNIDVNTFANIVTENNSFIKYILEASEKEKDIEKKLFKLQVLEWYYEMLKITPEVDEDLYVTTFLCRNSSNVEYPESLETYLFSKSQLMKNRESIPDDNSRFSNNYLDLKTYETVSWEKVLGASIDPVSLEEYSHEEIAFHIFLQMTFYGMTYKERMTNIKREEDYRQAVADFFSEDVPDEADGFFEDDDFDEWEEEEEDDSQFEPQTKAVPDNIIEFRKNTKNDDSESEEFLLKGKSFDDLYEQFHLKRLTQEEIEEKKTRMFEDAQHNNKVKKEHFLKLEKYFFKNS